MLVVDRYLINDSLSTINIGDNIVIKVLNVIHNNGRPKIRIGITAPKEMLILRNELYIKEKQKRLLGLSG